MNKSIEPFSRYNMIEKENCEELKRVRLMPEFLAKSAKQSALQKRNTHPHQIEVAEYYDMKLVWQKEDEEAISSGDYGLS